MENYKWLNLQLFAGEGTGDGGGEGAATGENATVDAGQRLRELGVPEDKIRRRAKYAAKAPEGTAKAAPVVQEATETKEQAAAAEAAARAAEEAAAAAAAAGADGIMIEVHNDPAHALCDGAQSLTPDQFADLNRRVNIIREAMK